MEVNEEQVTMVEELSERKSGREVWHLGIYEDCYFVNVSIGKAIVDSGASRTIVGEDVWRKWLDKMDKETSGNLKVHQFGGGNVVRSSYEVSFKAHVKVKNFQSPCRSSPVEPLSWLPVQHWRLGRSSKTMKMAC